MKRVTKSQLTSTCTCTLFLLHFVSWWIWCSLWIIYAILNSDKVSRQANIYPCKLPQGIHDSWILMFPTVQNLLYLLYKSYKTYPAAKDKTESPSPTEQNSENCISFPLPFLHSFSDEFGENVQTWPVFQQSPWPGGQMLTLLCT